MQANALDRSVSKAPARSRLSSAFFHFYIFHNKDYDKVLRRRDGWVGEGGGGDVISIYVFTCNSFTRCCFEYAINNICRNTLLLNN